MSISSKLKVACNTTESAVVEHATKALSAATNYSSSLITGEVGVVTVTLGASATHVIDLSGAGGGNSNPLGLSGDTKQFTSVKRIIIEITAGDKTLTVDGSDSFAMVRGVLDAGGKGLLAVDSPVGYTIDASHKFLRLVTGSGGTVSVVVNVTIIGAE